MSKEFIIQVMYCVTLRNMNDLFYVVCSAYGFSYCQSGHSYLSYPVKVGFYHNSLPKGSLESFNFKSYKSDKNEALKVIDYINSNDEILSKIFGNGRTEFYLNGISVKENQVVSQSKEIPKYYGDRSLGTPYLRLPSNDLILPKFQSQERNYQSKEIPTKCCEREFQPNERNITQTISNEESKIKRNMGDFLKKMKSGIRLRRKFKSRILIKNIKVVEKRDQLLEGCLMEIKSSISEFILKINEIAKEIIRKRVDDYYVKLEENLKPIIKEVVVEKEVIVEKEIVIEKIKEVPIKSKVDVKEMNYPTVKPPVHFSPKACGQASQIEWLMISSILENKGFYSNEYRELCRNDEFMAHCEKYGNYDQILTNLRTSGVKAMMLRQWKL